MAQKDRQGNDILLLTTGLPDSSGYICPLDQWLFAMLRDHGLARALVPQHIRFAVVHDWASGGGGLYVVHSPSADA